MRVFSLLMMTVGLIAAHGTAQDDHHGKTSENLIDLNQESFDKYVVNAKTNKAENGPWLIMFFAPWCGHCKRLTPIFDQFADTFGDGQRLRVGRVNCDDSENSNLCTAYDIGGFPTILYINGGHYYEYRGERSAQAFQSFVFQGGYENAESDVIPVKLEGIALYQKQFLKFLGQLGRSVEILFHKIGFGDLPKGVMYSIAGSVFALPFALMCYVICCMKDEAIEPPKRKIDAGDEKKPASILYTLFLF